MPGSGVFTQTFAVQMPVTDRIGHRRALDILGTLHLPEDRDLTDGSKFLWWLWVANLGPRVSDVIGGGIVCAELLTFHDHFGADFAFTRVDASVCFVTLSFDRRGNPKVTHWVQNPLAPSSASEQAVPSSSSFCALD